MEKELDCHEALGNFVKDYGAPESMIYDGAREQIGPGTKFQANLRKYGIHGHTSEREHFNQNPAEGVILELQKKVSRNVYNILSETTMDIRVPIYCQDYAVDGQPFWETAGTKFTLVNDRRNTRHIRVPRFCMV